MKLTPSQVKNNIRRGLRLLVDPELKPDECARVKAFFKYCCAYCGTAVESGKGDLDHLLSASRGGPNHISNRVFSCHDCNQKEKRDKDWREFLLEKGADFEEKEHRILEWLSSVEIVAPISDIILQTIEEESQRVTAAYDSACQKIRNIR